MAEFRQDLFVLSELNFKRGGFFVEFGAASGYAGSNTYLLEREFAWDGVLCEPAKIWHSELKGTRNANIETRCVWSRSNATIRFNELSSLSTIDLFSSQTFTRRRVREE